MTTGEEKNSIFRLLDAASNRAGEGLRVVEDYCRMVRGDRFLSRSLKELRHELVEALADLGLAGEISNRDAIADVGRTIQTETEYQRADAESVVKANLTRVQQSLRALEEFTKIIDPSIAMRIEALRYRSYSIEKAILVTGLSLDRLAEARLYVLIDGGLWAQSPAAFEAHVGLMINAGVDLIQFRDKSMSDRLHVAIGKRLTALTRDTQTRWIMNDRVDLAFATDADGVHLGQDDLTVAEARRVLGADRIIGVSTHNVQQAQQAVIDGANYIGVGPVFRSNTKSFKSFVGLELVKAVAREVRLPAFAIGGITGDNVASVVEAGLSRVAVSGAIGSAADAAASIELFQKSLRGV